MPGATYRPDVATDFYDLEGRLDPADTPYRDQKCDFCAREVTGV